MNRPASKAGLVWLNSKVYKGKAMGEWFAAVGFGVGLVAFVLGATSIIMGFTTNEPGSMGMQKKIEYGFFGVTGLVLCMLMTYALA